MNFKKIVFKAIFFILFSSITNAEVTGELKKWHKVTLIFAGPETSEQASPNPFLDYRLNATFKHSKSGKQYKVPGYYAADGNAADTSADSGNKWHVHFSPDETGTWQYSVSFRAGSNIAVDDNPDAGKSAGHFDRSKGKFNISPNDKKKPDLRARGRLNYAGSRYLQFAETKEFFLKQGADAPENLFAYADFDGNFKNDGHKDHLVKTWQPHIKDWKPGDPSWAGGKGKGLIGAVNYLASKGMNVFSFLTFNIEGDDRNVFPYINYNEKFRFDVSKLAQWEIVMEHAGRLGMFLHFKTQESENETWHDKGEVGIERKLYYRELIARFSHHLALNWNMGEENGKWNTHHKKEKLQKTPQRLAMAEYFWKHDPYKHHIVIHNGQPFDDILGKESKYTGASVQTNKPDFSQVHSQVLKWINKSARTGKQWAVACDEPGDASHSLVPDADNPAHDNARMNGLWGCLMAGGWGNEWYFGYKHAHSDLTCQDWSSRDNFWDQCRYALEFFDKQKIPFWQMQSKDSLTRQTNDFCFVKEGRIYMIYQKQGGPLNFDMLKGSYECGYFNPRTGQGADNLLNKKQIQGPGTHEFTPPDSKDWLLVIRSNDGGRITQNNKAKHGLSLSSMKDFAIINDREIIPAYKDSARKALAVDAKKYKDRFAAAETFYNGKDGNFNITLTALTETDGESTYKLLVNGKQVASAQNPPATEDYKAVNHLWKNIKLKKGDKIQVQFNSASNRQIPEGNGFAYSRGRWTGLTITDNTGVDNSKPSLLKPQSSEKAVNIKSLYDGRIFYEQDGFLAVEAEHFSMQEKTGKRKWYITTAESIGGIKPDGDPVHAANVSGGAYIEILPDTRRTHGDKLISGANFSNEPGKIGILSYPVVIENPGRYYIWARAYSTGSEDNGLHAGIDGTWPDSGKRLQWCSGKNSWRWESRQRTRKNHCGEPHRIYLDIKKPGFHLIQFSMREDGFEFDKWLMTKDKNFKRPEGTDVK